MNFDMNDIIVTKKEREAIEGWLACTPECYAKISTLNTEAILMALYVEITGAGRKDLSARLQRQFFKAFREAAEQNIAKFTWAHQRRAAK